MLPRQRQYGIFADDLIYYEQMGGAVTTIADDIGTLLNKTGTQLDKASLALGESMINTIKKIKLTELPTLTGQIRNVASNLLSRLMSSSAALKQTMIETFSLPSLYGRLPKKILNVFPVSQLAKVDPAILANKLDAKNFLVIKRDFPDVAEAIVREKNMVGAGDAAIEKVFKDNEILDDLADDAIKQTDGAKPPVPTSPVPGTVPVKPPLPTTPSPGSVKNPVKVTAEELNEITKTIDPELAAKAPSGSKADGTLKVETAESAKIDQAGWYAKMKANKGKILIGGVTLGAAAYGGFALDNFLKKNDTQFDIIQMELDKNDPDTSIWFYYSVKAENNFELTTNNWILLEKNDAVPQIPIDKIYKIAEVDNTARKIKILLNKTEMPTSIGHTGSFRYQTTYSNQLIETASDVAKGLGSGATQVATGLLGGILESLGLSKTAFFGGLIGIIVIIVILIVLFMVLKNRGGGE